jgi:hypothetical protein
MANTENIYLHLLPADLSKELFTILDLDVIIEYEFIEDKKLVNVDYWEYRALKRYPHYKFHSKYEKELLDYSTLQPFTCYLDMLRDIIFNKKKVGKEAQTEARKEVMTLKSTVLLGLRDKYQSEFDDESDELKEDQVLQKKLYNAQALNRIPGIKDNDLDSDLDIDDLVVSGYNFYDAYLTLRKYIKENTSSHIDILDIDMPKVISFYVSAIYDDDTITNNPNEETYNSLAWAVEYMHTRAAMEFLLTRVTVINNNSSVEELIKV